uniref:Uncharacterized protein n=3 Tax=Aegilops tauschii subsp. strangulata TaxID=200361 RepID=A0A453SZ34_AEGTS
MAMASQPPPPPHELDLEAFLPSSPASDTDADADHRRAVDDLLLLLSSSDSDDDDEPTRTLSTNHQPLTRIKAPTPPAKPSPSPLSSPSATSGRSTSASPSAALSSLVSRTFSNAAASSSRPLPSLFRGVRPSPKPGAALAAAAAASRAVLTPHAAAIRSRRTASAPIEKLLDQASEAEEVADKASEEVVGRVTEETVGGNGAEELEEDKHGEVGTEENSEPSESVGRGNVDSVAAENFDVQEQLGSKIWLVDQESSDEQITDGNLVESGEIVDQDGSVSDEKTDDELEVEHSDTDLEEQVESERIIDKVIEERLEMSRMTKEKVEERPKVPMKPLEWAEELEKRQASFGQHWEEGAAAQPMRLEGIGKGQPAIGYMQIEVDNPITRAMASPSFRQEHGSPQVLAVHRSYIATGMSNGSVIIVPSKYSIHQADDTDAKVSHCLLGAVVHIVCLVKYYMVYWYASDVGLQDVSVSIMWYGFEDDSLEYQTSIQTWHLAFR